MARVASKKPTTQEPATSQRPPSSHPDEPRGETRREAAPRAPAETRERTDARAPHPSTRAQEATGTAVANRARVPTLSTDMSAPTAFSDQAGRGMEQMRPQDLEQPRLKLIQGISPELQIYNDLKSGHFLHVAQEAIIDGRDPANPFIVVPICFDRRFILWRPRDMGGGILARADDGEHWDNPKAEFKVKLDRKDGGHEVTWRTARTVAESGLDAWGTMNPNDPQSPPAATLMFNYLLAFPFEPDLMPAVFTFQRALTSQGKKFNTKIMTAMGNRYPMYQLAFKFEPFLDTNGSGQEFWNLRAIGAGRVDDQTTAEYEKLYNVFASKGLQIKDLEGAQDEATGTDRAMPADRPEY